MPQVWPPQPPRIVTGSTVITRSTWTPIAFPAGAFTAPPTVFVQGQQINLDPIHRNVTVSGFEAWFSGAGSATADWIAVQP